MSIRDALKKVPFLRPAVRYLRRRQQIHQRGRAWARYAEAENERKLNIGSSSHVLPGWFNTDVQPFYANQHFLDATQTFPFPSNAFSFIRSEHMIEHVSHQDGLRMLKECHRVLRPGGTIRIATPDLRKLSRLYEKPLSAEQLPM
jgi:predicted SAM-dependent methyltransferase